MEELMVRIQPIGKRQVVISGIDVPNFNGDIFDMNYVHIELAAMTLYISRLGLKCSKCSCERYSVKRLFNSGVKGKYLAQCLKCGRKRSFDVIFDKEKVPK